MDRYKVIGIMSGTSLDGVDLAYCSFRYKEGSWESSIIRAETVPYDEEWMARLGRAPELDGLSLSLLHTSYGHYLGQQVRAFIKRHALTPDFIASHGHTVFHQPVQRMTLQIGSGAAIASETDLPVVCDFRSGDVALGGQGAPLVPIGDRMLFGSYPYCLNLGGFANISYESNGQRIAHDICAVNTVLNMLASTEGFTFDRNGMMARGGKLHAGLLDQLNSIGFYHQPPPKSLGKEWLQAMVLPLLDRSGLSVVDQLRTYTEHVAIQIQRVLDANPGHPVLVTGGGAFNTFLTERIQSLVPNPVVIPESMMVHFKEALVFAFLGVLRMRGEVNCLASTTGASRDSVGGAVFHTTANCQLPTA
jgi:anhydro-N-acetylmuramic acid kinase